MTFTPQEITQIANRLKSLHIPHESASAAHSGFDWIKNYGSLGSSSAGMLLTGPPGSGKTSTIHAWMGRFGTDRGARSDEKPVAYAKITGGPVTYRSIALDLLGAFGEEMIVLRRDTQQTLRQRIALYASVLKTSVLFIDEAQLIVSSKNEKVIREITEWLKTILNDVKVGFVFCGSDGFWEIFRTNDSLYRRCRILVEMKGYGVMDGEFRSFLNTWDIVAKPLRQVNLADDYWARRVHAATGGFIGLTADLLCDAAIHALEQGADMLRLQDLAAVHERRFPGSTSRRTNPFLG
ncbi:ATP-binding protein [Nitrospirillum amazonense]|uniref:ATP-binding protein n=1 Tax=Nitrospirillum amazonense TaxID=28077 RepID=UPI002412BCA5|nr:ATP-binding protein [Nitrospirillum amazonense]MDG3442875.1 ATP-binding protein [Nitrospirillum amazonense]